MKGTCLAMCCNYTPNLSHFTGSDYNDTNITLTISASSTIRRVNHVIEIFDDNINEMNQSFVIVGEIGPDVSDDIACFQVSFGDELCRGRKGVTRVNILDDDRRFKMANANWASDLRSILQEPVH